MLLILQVEEVGRGENNLLQVCIPINFNYQCNVTHNYLSRLSR